MKQPLDITLKALAVCILWGSAFAGAKIGFEYVPPIFLSAIRFTLAGLILVPVIIIKKIEVRSALRHWKFMLLFAFMQTFLQYGLFFMGLDSVPAAISAIIVGAGPLFIAIMAHLTLKDDKMSLRKVLSLGLGLAGIVFISVAGGVESMDSTEFYYGVALLIVSNIVGSYTNIMVVKKRDYNISPYLLTAFANFVGGVMLLVVSLIVEPAVDMATLPLEFYGTLLWLALIPAVSFSIWYGLLNREGVKVSELNMWKFVVPVTGCILSWTLLASETPDIPSVIGILIIVGALQLQYLPFRKRH